MKLLAAFLFGFLVFTPVAASVSVEQVNDMIVQKKPFYEKLDEFSAVFIGEPYILDPLGEENEFDPDPFYRFDAFDCITYVETVLALASASDFDDFLDVKKNISYKDGDVNFEERNHFFELDFVKNNKNLIVDITDELGEPTVLITREIDKKSWFKKMHDIRKSERKKELSLHYLPWDSNLKLINENFDEPAIFAVVLDNHNLPEEIGTNLLIGHVGFIFKKNNELILRHASSFNGAVFEEKFSDYVEKNKNNPLRVGYKVYQIKDKIIGEDEK